MTTVELLLEYIREDPNYARRESPAVVTTSYDSHRENPEDVRVFFRLGPHMQYGFVMTPSDIEKLKSR